MSKKVELSAEERAQLVLRMLSKEEPAVQIARRAGVAEQTLYRWRDEFISAGKRGLNGRGAEALQGKEIARLSAQLAEPGDWGDHHCQPRSKKTLGKLSASAECRAMIAEECALCPQARL
ncbi:MAG: helix-turn-helix domain-containing protein [Gammaproteobacteria bacterium]